MRSIFLSQVLAPEDMISPHIDELSMMTYLSQFPEAKLKPGAPISKRKMRKGDPTKVKVSGPGIKATGLDTNMPSAEFTVDPRGAGDGIISATVNTPDGPIEVKLEPQKNGTTKCSYVPNSEGDYEVEVKFNGTHVGESPYNVSVSQGVDPSACVAYGPGVEGGDIRAESPTEFWVETSGAGKGDMGIVVRGPKTALLNKYIDVALEEDNKYHVQYTPQQAGPHTVEVTLSGLHIKDSPFRVQVRADRPDASKCQAEGPGLEENGVEINSETWFDVHTKGAGKGELSVNIKGPHGTVDAQQETKEKGLDHFTYKTSESGEHVVTIKYGGEHIPGSRFKVMVEPPTDPSKCVASGPGLAPHGVRVNNPAKFTVRTKDAGHGDVEVKVIGPSGEIPCQVESAPYTFNYTYQASEPGEYTVDVKFAGEDIPNAPFPVAVTDASKVSITGPGMNGECLPVDVPLVYTIDTRGAGPGDVKAIVQDRRSVGGADQTDMVEGPLVTANADGTFNVEYTPTKPGLQKMNLTFGEAPIPNTPLKLNIFDASQVKAFGPGLEDGNKSGLETDFTVDMRAAGEGQLEVTVDGPADTPVTIKDQANGVVKCVYTPTVVGDYTVNVKYEGVDAPVSPCIVNVRPCIDSSLVKAYGPGLGLEEPLTTDMWAEFFVDYKMAGDGEPQVIINGPGGGEKFEQEQVEEGLNKYRYYIDPDEAGDYKIEISFADEPIPDSPYNVHVNWKTDPSRVKVFGPGIEGGFVKDWTEFNIDMSQAGEGEIDIKMAGPCEAQIILDDRGDGTATVKYLPEVAGEYRINVLFADQPVPGAPFVPVFVPETDASKVKAYGPGLKHDGVKVGDTGDFVIDTREAGKGPVDVVVDGPYWHGSVPTPLSPLSPQPPTEKQQDEPNGKSSGRSRAKGSANVKPKITSNNDDTYDVVYNPRKVGTYKVNILFADQAIPNSPYEVNVSDPSMVKVSGPGLDAKGEKLAEIPIISTADKEPVCWTVDCTDAGPGNLEAVIVGYDGVSKPLKVTEDDEDIYKVSFEPEKAGRYRLALKYAGNELRQSPIDVSLSDSSQVKVTGPGLAGGKIGEEMVIELDRSAAGEGGLSLSLLGPSQTQLGCDDHKDGTATLKFTPDVPGEYKLTVKFNDEDVPGSAFVVPVIDPTKCKISGSGITGDGAHVGGPAEVIVDTRDSGPAPVDIKVKYPSGEVATVEMVPSEKNPGVFTGSYEPTEPGNYSVDAKFADKDIEGSPFTVAIGDPAAVRAEGPGLETAFTDVPNIIDIFTNGAGPGEVGLDLQYADGSGAPEMASIEKVDDDHYQLAYTPRKVGEVEANVTFGGVPIGDKVVVPVLDLSKVRIEGPGVESGIVGEEAEFVVDATEAGKRAGKNDDGKEEDDLGLQITNAAGEPIKTDIVAIAPQKWQVKYRPEEAGNHTVKVQYCDQEVPASPVVVQVASPDAVRAYGDGLENAVVQEEASFTVDAANAGEGSLGLNITGPADCVINMEDEGNGIYQVCIIVGTLEQSLTFSSQNSGRLFDYCPDIVCRLLSVRACNVSIIYYILG